MIPSFFYGSSRLSYFPLSFIFIYLGVDMDIVNDNLQWLIKDVEGLNVHFEHHIRCKTIFGINKATLAS